MKKLFLLLTLILIMAISGCGDNSKNEMAAPSESNKTEDTTKSEAPAEPVAPVKISFAGDCTLGSFLGSDNRFANYWSEGPGYYLGNVKSIFESDDITFVNLEGPLTKHRQTAIKEFPMRGEPEYVEILTAASVEVCNLANNHIYDCGDEGFADTVNILNENNIKMCGEGHYAIIDVRGIKVGFLGYQGWEDYPELRADIENDIKKLREDGADVVIVEFHWGIERDYTSYDTQDNLAHFSIDSGADVVVGAHPHVVQGIEVYKDKIIAYSLGNFCFGANNDPTDKDTFILQLELDKNGNNLNPKIIPCRISSTKSYNDFCPTPVTGSEAERIINKLAKSSRIYPQTIDFNGQL